ncbi:DUF4232 domain-containing protein [Kitasatospora sp. CM 4170]|uniref:DUF4232 domain-containing protein n=1 Tax=Kitasatospora aburaviensis TaxID=67265 RepID=A0ABW1EUN9_9ACTN|nr:DUF4232 domain-containing protein [Kitasatospora sp. CM 4170]WNM49515.1 DUF4232 domain-containing protein [Kitasatospora sp. CM 4170]
MSVRRALFVPSALAGAVLALTACGPDTVAAGPRPAATSATSAPAGASGASGAAAPNPAAPPAAAASSGAQVPSGSGPAAAGPGAGKPTAGASRGGGAGGNGSAGSAASPAAGSGGADDDSYAYAHPCEGKNLSVRVTTRPQAPTQRVIEVRNQGPHACGLSYYPMVSLGDARSADRSKDVRPLVPGGLGGAPAYPVGAGRTAYAVIDLDPAGAGAGTASGIDQLNVLADGDHMPTAETRNFPLGTGAVVKPKLGLYRSSVVDAAASASTADRQP